MQDTAHNTQPGPRQIAVLEHAKLISQAETTHEENRSHPRNFRFTEEQIARTAAQTYGELAQAAYDRGQVKMARACATVAAHFVMKYDLQPEAYPPVCYVQSITDGDGITRRLSRPVQVFC